MRAIKDFKNQRAQSVVELAIFGSIVIFVIGLMLKSGLATSHRSNMDLRAFRRALQESYLTANGEYAGQFSAARNRASILILEDRLTIDPSSKQGTRDRAPYMAQGSGTMTHSLFMDVNPADIYDQAVYDVWINGQRFPFTTSANKTLDLQAMYTAGDIPDCNADGYGLNTGVCYDGDPAVQAANNVTDNEFVFYRKVYKGEEGVWCLDAASCPDFPPERRFDLDFDGIADVTLGDIPILFASFNWRENFGWQWTRVAQDEVNEEGLYVDIDGDMSEEKVIDCSNLAACQVVDFQAGDVSMADEGMKARYEKWRQEQITAGFPDPGPLRDAGLDRDMTVYSFTKDGTLLRNVEGKLYTVDGQFVRNETKQDHLDIIERVFYLSNATDRFCENPTTPRDWQVQENWAKANGVRGLVNPVERCGDCFSAANAKYTCMDVDGPVIFVRSRIRDRRRVRWVTRTGDR